MWKWENNITVSVVHSWDKTINKTFPGDILYLRAFGQHIVVLNSVDSAVALLEKRAHKYSDRPVFPMLELFVPVFHWYQSLTINWYIEQDGMGMVDVCDAIWW